MQQQRVFLWAHLPLRLWAEKFNFIYKCFFMSDIAEFAGTVPHNYDRYLGPHLFEPYALDIIKRIEGLNPKKVLEIACGTGRVTRHLSAALPPESQLWATDLNNDMLQLAKTKIAGNKITWQQVDAQALPFDDAAFDLVVCQFGVMFFPDKAKAFSEVYRVLQPVAALFSIPGMRWKAMQHPTAHKMH